MSVLTVVPSCGQGCSPSVQYRSLQICRGGGLVGPVTVSPPGGMFRVFSAGIVVQAQTGIIDPGASQPGTYLVRYVISGLTCQDSVDFTVQVVPQDDPTFLFVDSVCLGGKSLLPDSIAFPGGDFFPLSPGLVLNSQKSGEIDLRNSSPGTHLIRYVTPGPCKDSGLVQVTLLGQSPAGFYYPDSVLCTGSGLVYPVLTGRGGGRFFEPSGYLAVDSVTGVLDLRNQQDGLYTVLYESPGRCPDTHAVRVQVLPQGDARFRYTPDQFCVAGPDPVPVILGDSNGVFRSPFGDVVFRDSITGQLDLAATPPGDSLLVEYFAPGDLGGCPDSSVQFVSVLSVDSSTVVAFPTDSFCAGAGVVRPNLLGQPGGAWQLFPPTGTLDQATGALDLSNTAVGQYRVIYFPPGACSDSASTVVTVLAPEQLALGYGLSSLCEGDTMLYPDGVLNAGGFFSGDSLLPDRLTGRLDFAGVWPGTYTIRYNTGGACPADTFFAFSVLEAPDALLLSNFEGSLCEGEALELMAFGGSQYRFFRNGILVQGPGALPVLGVDSAGADTFVVEVRSELGCVDRDSVQVSVRPVPELEVLGFEERLAAGMKIRLVLTGQQDSIWVKWYIRWLEGALLQGMGTVSLLPSVVDSGGFWLADRGRPRELSFLTPSGFPSPVGFEWVLEPVLGTCTGRTFRDTVLVLPGTDPFFIPGLITPNGDGHNDQWEIRWQDFVDPALYVLKVFNRAGGLVYQEGPVTGGWDGNGVPDGVYYWVLMKAGVVVERGGVTLKSE